MSAEQRIIIPYAWQGLDYTPTWENEETGATVWGTRKYHIFMWGHDQFNDPVCWVIDNYLPHCYVKLNVILEDEEQMAPLILNALDQNLIQYIKEESNKPGKAYLKGLTRLNNIIVGYQAEKKRPMFYWNTRQDSVYKVYFDLETTMHLCYEYLDKRSITMPTGFLIPASAYNNGTSDRIPTEEKLIVEMKLERCSWMFAPAVEKDGPGLTTLTKEYSVIYNQLQMMPPEFAIKLGFPKPSSISFDSETFSEVFNRFPKASRLHDEMYAAGFRHRVYASLSDKTPKVHNYIFVIWDVQKYGELKKFTKEYGDTTYIYCRHEVDFFNMLFAYIIRLDPSWIITFNGLGFDWDYVEQRCDIFGIKVPNTSRIRNWNKSQFVRGSWKKYTWAWPQYPGRIDVDMLFVIRGQIKYNSYKLKNVAKALLPAGEEKIELPYKEQFRIYAAKEIDGMNKIMDYLHMDIFLPERLFDKLNMAVYLHTNASVMRVNPMELYTEGQSIRCVSQLYDATVTEGMYVNSRTVTKSGKYIGGLVFDQIPGVYRNVLTFDWNSLYPSKMKTENICFSTLVNEKWEAEKPEAERIPDSECHVVEGEVPIVDKKTKEVIANEFHRFRYISKKKFVGLLPKIVTKLNSLRSDYKKEMEKHYGLAKQYKKDLDALRKASFAEREAIAELKKACDKSGQTQKLPADNGGLVPGSVTLPSTSSDYDPQHTSEEERSVVVREWAVRAKAFEDGEEERKKAVADLTGKIDFHQMEGDIWNVKQMAVKVSANSMYGFMGMKSGKYSFTEGGMSTTLGGRDALRTTMEIVVGKFKAHLVYGDTDSVMVQFPEDYVNASNYKTRTKEIAQYISDQFPEGMNIAPENYFLTFFTVTKKRYAGIKAHPDHPDRMPTYEEVFPNKLYYPKGLISVRGNSCEIVYDNFDPFMVRMLLQVPLSELFDFIHAMVLRIMRREYPLEDYRFVQRLGAHYKNNSYEMALFSDRLKQNGRPHRPGEELEFVYARTYGDCLVGHKMQAPDLFEEQGNVLDTLYYVTNKIAKPLEQLLTCVYDDTVLKNYEKRIIRPRKPTVAQKVTKHWHLELYIRGYVASIHRNWLGVLDHIKSLGLLAEERGYLNYVIDEEMVKRRMKECYSVDWLPENNAEKTSRAKKREPLLRHEVWKFKPGFCGTEGFEADLRVSPPKLQVRGFGFQTRVVRLGSQRK